MNHQAEIEGINSLQGKGESAIMACNPVAVRKITIRYIYIFIPNFFDVPLFDMWFHNLVAKQSLTMRFCGLLWASISKTIEATAKWAGTILYEYYQ
jgi:hypothetical protein